MQFVVIGRLIEPPAVPPQQVLAMLRATFEQFRDQTNPAIKAIYPLADQRATVFVVEANSGDDLNELLNSFPGSALSTFETHPITTPESVLRVLAQWEQSMDAQQAG